MIKFGNINNKGVRKRTWRDSDNNIDFLAFPMLWKKLPITICAPTNGKTVMIIRKARTAFSVNSGPAPKMCITVAGMSSPVRQAAMVMHVAAIML